MNNRNKNRSNFYAMKDCSYLSSIQFFSLAGFLAKIPIRILVQFSHLHTRQLWRLLVWWLCLMFHFYLVLLLFVTMHLLKNNLIWTKMSVLSLNNFDCKSLSRFDFKYFSKFISMKLKNQCQMEWNQLSTS